MVTFQSEETFGTIQMIVPLKSLILKSNAIYIDFFEATRSIAS